ncbi:hypothetical protein [Hydrogenophaga sp.]|uniref:hypothetical protein n=1 Tax=Hydrogenophaga sp. TaxID=1904254 RepID=UPI003561DFE3
MNRVSRYLQAPLVVCLAVALSSAPALAEKPDWVGKPGKAEKSHKSDKGDGGDKGGRVERSSSDTQRATSSGVSVQVQIGGYFGEPQRVAVRDYYAPRLRGAKCPPGLAKKHNGCQPPGQAKKWRVGQPLPAAVVYYPVPHAVSVQIGLPPAGHKYVRVAADILLIAVGTGMVIDAIEDLSR